MKQAKKDETKTLSDRIKFLILKNGGYDSFSSKTGIPVSTLSNYSAGRNDPKSEPMGLIADIGGVSIQWLATGREPTYSESFAERLNELADKMGGSEALAKETGINHDNMLDYLDGMRTPQAASVVSISRVGGVSLEWLLTGEDTSSQPAGYSIDLDWGAITKKFDIDSTNVFSCLMSGDHMHPTI